MTIEVSPVTTGMLGILREVCPWLPFPTRVAWKELPQMDNEDGKFALKAPDEVGSAKVSCWLLS